jgi:hypothetical protein
MNTGALAKAKALLSHKRLQNLTDKIHYAALLLLAKVSGSVFWFWEQKRSLLQDRLANEKIGYE